MFSFMDPKQRPAKPARPRQEPPPEKQPRNLEPQAEQEGAQQIEESTREIPRS
jgi:hypothetical protein